MYVVPSYESARRTRTHPGDTPHTRRGGTLLVTHIRHFASHTDRGITCNCCSYVAPPPSALRRLNSPDLLARLRASDGQGLQAATSTTARATSAEVYAKWLQAATSTTARGKGCFWLPTSVRRSGHLVPAHRVMCGFLRYRVLCGRGRVVCFAISHVIAPLSPQHTTHTNT